MCSETPASLRLLRSLNRGKARCPDPTTIGLTRRHRRRDASHPPAPGDAPCTGEIVPGRRVGRAVRQGPWRPGRVVDRPRAGAAPRRGHPGAGPRGLEPGAADILEYTIQSLGEAQAHAHTAQLAARIEALAAGTGPRARRCELLMQGIRNASGLTYCREGSHFLILREKRDTLEVVEVLHGRMNLDEHLERLAKEGHHPRPRP